MERTITTEQAAALFAAAPPFAEHIAMDKDTTFWWFTTYPIKDEYFFKWIKNPKNPGAMGPIETDIIIYVDWENSLISKTK